jgi:TRAP-type C4-dicarboxylate transport system permease small subunit
MPSRISSWMALVAIVAISLGCLIAGGRWYQSMSDFERSSFEILITVMFVSVVIFSAIVAPLFVFDFVKDLLKRRREALETWAALREGMRSRAT